MTSLRCWCAEAVAEYLDGKIKAYAHLELQRLFEQVRAYEFTFLARESEAHQSSRSGHDELV